MRAFYADHCPVELPLGNRFPMHKYAALRAALLGEGVLRESELLPAPAAPIEALLAAHDADYVHAFLRGELPRERLLRIGFPWSSALVARTLASAGGTLAAVDAALESGFAGVLAGGTHHAHRAEGAGYCVFNDLAIAALALLRRERVRRVLVVDLDVHQGDGTAAIFAHDSRVFTFSMHGARNFPARKQQSDLDVALEDGTSDEPYLEALHRHLELALERARPDFVLYQGGVDPLAGDRLGRLALTHAGLAARDRAVFRRARAAGLPLVATLGGGYCDPIAPTIEAHLATYREARACFEP